MSDQPERAAGNSRCSRCGERLRAGAPHKCPKASSSAGLLPTLEPGARPVGVDTPVKVKVTVRHESSQDLVGQVIGERYQIQRLLGYGGMGVVYQARHVVLDKLFAVKLLLTPQNTEYRRRFLQEAKLASQISHPNTVFLSDFGVLPDGRSYLVMELLRGTTLSQLLTRGRLDPLRACQIAAQIARGLSAVHDQGVIHRDLKPENVFLLDPSGQEGSKDFVKIVDFGIAKQADDRAPVRTEISHSGILLTASGADLRLSPNTLPGTLLGTPGYMSPEQARGGAVDFRVDQYSLGCILFEMLSGTLPFDDETIGGLLRKHLDEPPPSVRQRFPQLPVSAALDSLVLRLLSKRPAARFSSMREVAETLEREIDLLLVERGERSSSSKSTWLRLSRSLVGTGERDGVGRRVPLWALTVPTSAMLLGLVAWLVVQLFRPTEKPPRVGLVAEELAELRERAVAVLQDGLHADRPEQRAAAVRGLWQTRDPALRPQLEARLDDPSQAVEAEAADALGQLGQREAEARLQSLLERPVSGTVRVAAASALLRLGSPAGQRTLDQALTDADSGTRLAAAFVLCENSQPAAVPVLRTLLPMLLPSDKTNAYALACLAQLGEPAARRTLRERLAGTNQEALYAAAALWSLGETSGQERLKALVAHRGPLQVAAARYLAGPWAPTLVEIFRRVATDRSAAAVDRELAAAGLGAAGDPREARLLGPLLTNDTAAALRQAAAAAVVSLAPADSATLTAHSLSWARSTLDAATGPVRLSATRVLGEIPSPEAVVLLLSTLGEREVPLRRAAAQALGRRPERATLRALLRALSDEDPSVRMESLRALTAVAGRLQERGVAPRMPQLTALLQRLQDTGTPIEQLLATSSLFRLGNSRDRDRLRTLTTTDPELRALLLAQLATDTPLLLSALSDPSPRVQRVAAQRLAALGDRRAVPVLRAELQEGGPQVPLDFALLRRLGEKVELPPTADQVIAALPIELRLTAVETVRGFPAEFALPVLYRAARDLDPTVRQKAAEVAADLPRGSHGPEGAAILRTLLLDRDPTVWTLARALLARVYAASGEPVEPTLPASSETKVVGAAPVPGPDPTVPALAAGEGRIIIDAPSGVFFQLDRRGWQTGQSGTAAPLTLPSGPHTVVSLAESQEILVAEGLTLTVKVRESSVEQFLQAGLAALRKDDNRTAQRQLERARALCEHDHAHEVPCHTLDFLASYHLGTLFEREREYGRAMTDFRHAAELAGRTKGHSELKGEVDRAIRRLVARVGEVQVGTVVDTGCRRTTFWLDPGVHRLDVGNGQFETVNVRAGQTLDAGGCR